MADEKYWLFDGTNFGNWKYRIEVLMEDKGLLDCLEKAIEDEDYAKEVPGDTAVVLAEKKKKLDLRISRDRKCKNILVNRIGEDQLDYVKDTRTAKEAWDALKNVFERVGIAGKLLLKKQFQELKLKEGGDVKANLLQFEKVLRDMRAAGVKTDEEDTDQLTMDYVKKRLMDESAKRANHDVSQSRIRESAFTGNKEMRQRGLIG
ncbi:uncharacterized protein LOC118507114 [Anopheles stephensi]|uniref:uncharacterized protein LOC118507114 n=1 Tax=Anopheles stephensi TaxID=30069 RepID=UPI00165886D1|nr:uncharacterized protein LOC118507114 [Anopheles stephensi]